MLKKSFLTVLLCLSCFGAVPSFAEDPEICSDEVAAEIFERCTAKKSRTAQRKCITDAAKAINSLKSTLGTEFSSYVTTAATIMKKGRVSDPNFDSLIKTAGSCVPLSQITNKLKNSCCKLKYKNKRQSCLNSTKKLYKVIKGYTGTKFFTRVKNKVSNLLKAPTCGAGGEASNGCDVMRSMGGGFLHKYPSDHGNVVLLLPSYDSASSCDYITTRGEKLFNLRYYYRANGNRQHWRPYSGGYCGDFRGNRPVYARCKIRGQYHCWSIWNPCTRVE